MEQNTSKSPKKQVETPKTDIRAQLSFRGGKPVSISKNPDGSKTNSGNISSSSYELGNYNWAEAYDEQKVIDSSYPVPKMILREYQPIRGFRYEEVVGQAAVALAQGATSYMLGKLGVFGRALESQLIRQTATLLGQALIEKGSKKAFSPTSETSMGFVRNLLEAVKLGSYEIPFLSDAYLKADTTAGWAAGGAEKIFGEDIGQILEKNFSVNFPMAPIWAKTDDDWIDASTEFYLINNSTDNLKKNFRFLNSFISGAFWTQLGFYQQSPNVYDITVPGRFHTYFAAIGVEINYVGKTRLNGAAREDLAKDGLKGLPDSESMLFPDAYIVKVSVKNLCPNNFNVYLDTLINSELTNGNWNTGEHTKRYTDTALKSAAQTAYDKTKDLYKEGAQKVKNSINTTSTAITNAYQDGVNSIGK